MEATKAALRVTVKEVAEYRVARVEVLPPLPTRRCQDTGNWGRGGNIWTKRVSRDIKGKISVEPVAVNINLLIFANYITLIYLI